MSKGKMEEHGGAIGDASEYTSPDYTGILGIPLHTHHIASIDDISSSCPFDIPLHRLTVQLEQ